MREKDLRSEAFEEQLEKGTVHELEHTKNKEIAKQIALDHLKENPKYYDFLEEMESKTIYKQLKKDAKKYYKAWKQKREMIHEAREANFQGMLLNYSDKEKKQAIGQLSRTKVKASDTIRNIRKGYYKNSREKAASITKALLAHKRKEKAEKIIQKVEASTNPKEYKKRKTRKGLLSILWRKT